MTDKLYSQAELDERVRLAEAAALREAAEGFAHLYNSAWIEENLLKKISPTASLALDRHDAELRAEAGAAMEKLKSDIEAVSDLPMPEDVCSNEDQKEGFSNGVCWMLNAIYKVFHSIPTTPAASVALERLIAKEREDEHAKLCPMCSIFPSEKSGCIRLAELRGAADVAGKEKSNAKEE